VSGERRLDIEDSDGELLHVVIRVGGAIESKHLLPAAALRDAAARERFLCWLSDLLPSNVAGLETSFLRKKIQHVARRRARP
jgi:hypothetical protein